MESMSAFLQECKNNYVWGKYRCADMLCHDRSLFTCVLTWISHHSHAYVFLIVCVFLFLLDVNAIYRKIAVKAAANPQVVITQDGDNLTIKTSTSVRTTNISFVVGQEFKETTVDGRECMVRNTWTSINYQMFCFLGSLTHREKKWVYGKGTVQIASNCLIWLFIIFGLIV